MEFQEEQAILRKSKAPRKSPEKVDLSEPRLFTMHLVCTLLISDPKRRIVGAFPFFHVIVWLVLQIALLLAFICHCLVWFVVLILAQTHNNNYYFMLFSFVNSFIVLLVFVLSAQLSLGSLFFCHIYQLICFSFCFSTGRECEPMKMKKKEKNVVRGLNDNTVTKIEHFKHEE